MQFRNAQYNSHGTIDCEANHPRLGWIPMTLSENDTATSGMYFDAAKVADKYIEPQEPAAMDIEI